MIFEALDLYRALDLKSNPMDGFHFEINFKRTATCPATRADINESSKQRTYRRYHCSAWRALLYKWRSYHM